jgi:hypothetical protein
LEGSFAKFLHLAVVFLIFTRAFKRRLRDEVGSYIGLKVTKFPTGSVNIVRKVSKPRLGAVGLQVEAVKV